MFDKQALRIKMLSCSCSAKELSQILGISTSALYRRLNGSVYFTVPEVLRCADRLSLTSEERDQIFFTAGVA